MLTGSVPLMAVTSGHTAPAGASPQGPASGRARGGAAKRLLMSAS